MTANPFVHLRDICAGIALFCFLAAGIAAAFKLRQGGR